MRDRVIEFLLAWIWRLGHRRTSAGDYCRWCGLETRHILTSYRCGSGEAVFIHNEGCPVYMAGKRMRQMAMRRNIGVIVEAEDPTELWRHHVSGRFS